MCITPDSTARTEYNKIRKEKHPVIYELEHEVYTRDDIYE